MISTPMVIFCCLTVFCLFLTIGTLFFFFQVTTQLQYIEDWYSLGRHVTIGTPVVIFAVLTVF